MKPVWRIEFNGLISMKESVWDQNILYNAINIYFVFS